jgi:hypothetical protein
MERPVAPVPGRCGMTPNPSNPTQTEDYVLVPRVPTREMIDAALCKCPAWQGYPPPEDAYAAMLSATPPQPSAAESETQPDNSRRND